jgi:hypothetical protein
MPVFGAPATPAAPAPTTAAPIAPAPSTSPADTLVAELNAPAVEQNPFASFQNNTPAAEPQPMQQFAQSEQPLPAQPLQAQPVGPTPISSGTGDIVLDMSQPKGRINKKLLAIIAGVVLVAIVAVVAVFFLIPKDRATKEDAEELYSLLGWVSLTEQCPNVSLAANDINVSSEEYQSRINICKDNATRISTLLKKMESISNSGFRDVFVPMKSAINENVVLGSDLEKDLTVYSAWHAWVLGSSKNMDAYQSKTDVDSVAYPLINSGNETLAKFGNDWMNARKAVIDAELDAEAYEWNSEKTEALSNAQTKLDEVVDDAPDLGEITGIGKIVSDSSLKNVVFKYGSYIRSNHEKVF